MAKCVCCLCVPMAQIYWQSMIKFVIMLNMNRNRHFQNKNQLIWCRKSKTEQIWWRTNEKEVKNKWRATLPQVGTHLLGLVNKWELKTKVQWTIQGRIRKKYSISKWDPKCICEFYKLPFKRVTRYYDLFSFLIFYRIFSFYFIVTEFSLQQFDCSW